MLSGEIDIWENGDGGGSRDSCGVVARVSWPNLKVPCGCIGLAVANGVGMSVGGGGVSNRGSTVMSGGGKGACAGSIGPS